MEGSARARSMDRHADAVDAVDSHAGGLEQSDEAVALAELRLVVVRAVAELALGVEVISEVHLHRVAVGAHRVDDAVLAVADDLIERERRRVGFGALEDDKDSDTGGDDNAEDEQVSEPRDEHRILRGAPVRNSSRYRMRRTEPRF